MPRRCPLGAAWLAAVTVVNTVISLYYYLRVIGPAVLEPAERPRRRAETSTGQGPLWRQPLSTVLAVTGVATVALGVAAEPLLRLAERATMLGG